MNDHSFPRHRHRRTLKSVSFGFIIVDFVTWLIAGTHNKKKHRRLMWYSLSLQPQRPHLAYKWSITMLCSNNVTYRLLYYTFSLRYACTTMWAKFNLISADHFLCLLSPRLLALISFYFVSEHIMFKHIHFVYTYTETWYVCLTYRLKVNCTKHQLQQHIHNSHWALWHITTSPLYNRELCLYTPSHRNEYTLTW